MMKLKIVERGKYQTLQLENARIGYKNFSGAPTKFNAAGGRRTFSLFLDPEVAEELSKFGFNVRVREPKEGYEEDGVLLSLPVNVRYKESPADRGRDPMIVLISSRGRTTLTPETVGILDWALVEHVDVMFNPYRSVRADGEKYMTAYLDKMYVTIQEDELDLKYSSVPSAEGELPIEVESDDPF